MRDYTGYGQEDTTKWAVVEVAPFTASGFNEIIASFQTKAAARDWLNAGHVGSAKSRRGRYTVMRKKL